MPSLRRLLLCVVLALPVLGRAELASKEDVLKAIATFESHAMSPQALDAVTVVTQFAEKSPAVAVALGQQTLPWMGEDWKLPESMTDGISAVLLAAYIGGNIRRQLETGKAEDDPYYGWLLAIEAYRQFTANVEFKSPALEALVDLKRKGKLREHADKVKASSGAQTLP